MGYQTITLRDGEIKFIYSLLKKPKNVLDIGCNQGDFGRILSDTQFWGIEYDEELCHIAKKYYKDVFPFDINSGDHYPSFQKNFFDGIILKDILEHVVHVQPFFSYLTSILKQNGRIYISVPYYLSSTAWGDYTHYRCFSEIAFYQLASNFGYKVDYLKFSGGFPLQDKLFKSFAFSRFLYNIPFLGRLFRFLFGYHLGINIECVLKKI